MNGGQLKSACVFGTKAAQMADTGASLVSCAHPVLLLLLLQLLLLSRGFLSP